MHSDKAYKKAQELANLTEEITYVVCEDGFHVATSEELNTYWIGVEPIEVIEPAFDD